MIPRQNPTIASEYLLEPSPRQDAHHLATCKPPLRVRVCTARADYAVPWIEASMTKNATSIYEAITENTWRPRASYSGEHPVCSENCIIQVKTPAYIIDFAHREYQLCCGARTCTNIFCATVKHAHHGYSRKNPNRNHPHKDHEMRGQEIMRSRHQYLPFKAQCVWRISQYMNNIE